MDASEVLPTANKCGQLLETESPLVLVPHLIDPTARIS
jgi:hypothetical protein